MIRHVHKMGTFYIGYSTDTNIWLGEDHSSPGTPCLVGPIRSFFILLSLYFPNPCIQVVLKEVRDRYMEDPGRARDLTKVEIISPFLQTE